MVGQLQSSYVERVSAGNHPLWSGRGPLLRHLDVELTERCNNRCVHCWINRPAADKSARKRELSTTALRAILKDAAALGALSVRFTGGEPLLREDFSEIYLAARQLGLKVILCTNARGVTPELADLLARIPPLEPVEITVYGMSQASYEAVSRVAGSHAECCRGVRLLLQRRVRLLVRGIHLPQNEHEREAFEAWAASIPGIDRAPRHTVFLDLRARRDDLQKNRRIAKLRPGPRESLDILRRDGDAYRRDALRICSRLAGPRGSDLFLCDAGRNVSLDAYGMLQPCLGLRHPETVYDLKAGSLEDALRVFFPRLRRRRAVNPEYLSRCARCFLLGLCDQCPAKSWIEHGTLDTPVQYLCDAAHAQARDLGLLGEDEKGWEVVDGCQRLDLLKGRPEAATPPPPSPSPIEACNTV